MNWKPLYNTSKIYEISDTGKFKSVAREYRNSKGLCHRKEKLLTIRYNSKGGYVAVYIDGKNKTISIPQAVYRTFVGDIPSDQEIKFVNGNPKDNTLKNLYLDYKQESFDNSQPIPKECVKPLNWLCTRLHFLATLDLSDSYRGVLNVNQQVGIINLLYPKLKVEKYSDSYIVRSDDECIANIKDANQVTMREFLSMVLAYIICHLGLDEEEVRFRNIQGRVRAVREVPRFAE